MAKNLDSVYERGRRRSGAWRRMRLDKGQEFVTGGYTPGAKYFDAVIFGYYADGKLRLYAGRPVAVSPPCCARKSEILPRPSDSYALLKVFVSLRDGIEYQLNPA